VSTPTTSWLKKNTNINIHVQKLPRHIANIVHVFVDISIDHCTFFIDQSKLRCVTSTRKKHVRTIDRKSNGFHLYYYIIIIGYKGQQATTNPTREDDVNVYYLLVIRLLYYKATDSIIHFIFVTIDDTVYIIGVLNFLLFSGTTIINVGGQ
jgi:hypothetical protein